MKSFNRITNGFNYIFEEKLSAGEEMIIKMPSVSSNKRGINDIGWQSDGEVTLYGTLSKNPEGPGALWQKIEPSDEVNKTISALKAVNSGEECTLVIRALLN